MKNFIRKVADKLAQSSFSQALTLINIGVSKASVNIALRQIDPLKPITWEFSGFSQNGEDGITEYLTRFINEPNFYFVEIGASDLTENNTSFFAFCRRYSGLMIEGSFEKYLIGHRILNKMGMPYIDYRNQFVGLDNIENLLKDWIYKNPDIFSLDIDSVDYYIMEKILDLGYRPKICIMEYNSNFGDQEAITIPFSPNFDWTSASPSMTYWGVSILAWKKLFTRFGYKFITAEQSGSNAYFVDEKAFSGIDFDNLLSVNFVDNRSQILHNRKKWQERFEKIKHLPYNRV